MKRGRKLVLLCRLAAFVLLLAPTARSQSKGVAGTRHDLSLYGGGDVKASAEARSCVFCHTAHGAKPATPLWNHELSSVPSYSLYNSSTFVQAGAPSTLSERAALCLSCHDGTVGLGVTVTNGSIPLSGTMTKGKLGTDLSRDHPSNFNMPAVDDGEIKLSLTMTPPTTSDPAVKLFNYSIECVTCHEPHEADRDMAVQFMARSNANGALCLACHDGARGRLAGWPAAAHATAPNTVALASGMPYPNPGTVAVNACASCHKGHDNAGTGARLLRGVEEGTCTSCHASSGNVLPAAPNVIAELTKTYRHPTMATSSPPHDPAESLPISDSRHAECADCHNPHAAQVSKTGSVPPLLQPALSGVSGIAASDGTPLVPAATYEYEVCFKCHANSTNKPQSYFDIGFGPARKRKSFLGLTDPFNTRSEFLSEVARHNVVRPSRGTVAPSLRPTMLTINGAAGTRSLAAGTYLYCSDCHNSDSPSAGGGTAASGPHGSKWFHILERRYEYNLPPPVPGGDFAPVGYVGGPSGPYALCDKCHDVASLVSNSGDVVFRRHREHVVDGNVACASCHASHGIQSSPGQQYSGTVQYSSHLVDLDLSIAGSTGDPGSPFIDTSSRTCNVVCHGEKHTNYKY